MEKERLLSLFFFHNASSFSRPSKELQGLAFHSPPSHEKENLEIENVLVGIVRSVSAQRENAARLLFSLFWAASSRRRRRN
jgi:hypothetical protein